MMISSAIIRTLLLSLTIVFASVVHEGHWHDDGDALTANCSVCLLDLHQEGLVQRLPSPSQFIPFLSQRITAIDPLFESTSVGLFNARAPPPIS